jgi:hypothetical protein
MIEGGSVKWGGYKYLLPIVGELMQNCHVSGEDQKRILQAYTKHDG